MTSTLKRTKTNTLIEVHNVPVVEATPDYATGDLIGGKQEFADAVEEIKGAGAIRGLTITSAVALSTQIDCIFFDADPVNTTFTENSAFALHANDLDKVIGAVKVDTFFAFSANAMGVPSFGEMCIPFNLTAGTSLWVAMVARGAINLASASDLQVRIAIERL